MPGGLRVVDYLYNEAYFGVIQEVIRIFGKEGRIGLDSARFRLVADSDAAYFGMRVAGAADYGLQALSDGSEAEQADLYLVVIH